MLIHSAALHTGPGSGLIVIYVGPGHDAKVVPVMLQHAMLQSMVQRKGPSKSTQPA